MSLIKPKIKICCIASTAEAELAIEYGASALGLVGRMPSGPGPISDERIAEIARSIPSDIATFLLTSETSAAGIIRHHQATKTNTIQIVDRLQSGSLREIRSALPGITLVQVIHVTGSDAVEEAVIASELADALLLDSGNPKLPVKELGGTGRTHDWSISRMIVERAKAPVYLAGGLNANNVRKAIDEVRPYGVDVCSGVRTDGRLDREKLARFVRAVRNP
jgi:phosphoribosylanthranilate isomerase